MSDSGREWGANSDAAIRKKNARAYFQKLVDRGERQPLTERQAQIYEYIWGHIQEYHFPPSVRDIVGAFSLKSPNGVMGHLLALEKKGWITRERGPARGITLCGVKVVLEVAK